MEEKVRRGNTIQFVYQSEKIQDFSLLHPRAFLYAKEQGLLVGECEVKVMEDKSSLEILWDGMDQCHLGMYSIVLKYIKNGHQYIEDIEDAFQLVRTTSEAN